MKGIWNRLRLALLGGILAFAGAGIVSPLAGGVVAEAASSDWVGKTFEKISSVDDLQDGDAILLASNGNFASSYTSSYFKATNGSTGNSVVCTDEFEVFLLAGENGKFTLECDALSDGYYVYYSGSGNAVHRTTSQSSADTWTFSFSSNKFVVTNGDYPTRILQYNSSSPRFACYTSSQQNLDVYRYVPIVYDEIRAVGTLEKTEYYEGEVFDPSGIEIHAFISGVDQGPIDLSRIVWEPSILTAGTTSIEAVYTIDDGTVLRCTIGGLTVSAREVTGIEVSVPSDLRYRIGDERDYEGVTVWAVYSVGPSVDVTSDAVFDPEKGGRVGVDEEGKTTEVTVTYLGFSDTFSYDVSFSPALEYTASEDDFNVSGNTASIHGNDWVFIMTGSTYMGFEGGNSARGVQLGSGNKPASEIRLRSPIFVGAGKSLVSEIVVNASTANNATANLSVYVGGELVGTNKLTTTATDYAYVLDERKVGHIEVAYTPSSGSGLTKAVYLKSIVVNGSSVIGTGDDDAIAALSNLEAVDGCVYSTPEEIANLESIVDEYDATCANYPAFASAMLDDYESGDVAHENGIQKDYVAAGEKAESIRGRITAPEAQPFFSFQGDGNDGMNWAIGGASLGIAILGAAGYLFYRKKKVAR